MENNYDLFMMFFNALSIKAWHNEDKGELRADWISLKSLCDQKASKHNPKMQIKYTTTK
jgi:hypothetical protein